MGTKYQRLDTYPEDETTGALPGDDHMTYFADIAKSWHHVENLDDFFRRVYLYHQRNGFLCIATTELFTLCQFIFVILLSVILLQCIDYPVLFGDTENYPILGNSSIRIPWPPKVKLQDVVLPLDQCLADTSLSMQILFLMALIFWIFRCARAGIVLTRFWETRMFYETALVIPSRELENYTWFEVLDRLKKVQYDQQMCIHKRELTSLDIYSRILRFKNYEIALINKEILPVKFYVPFFGDYTFLSQGLKFNFGFILFWGPWAPFSNNWSLREVFKRKGARNQLANEMSNRILLVGLANLALSPFIFFYQLLLSFFSYADLIKRDPSSLGMRKWSLFSRLYLRHYNEVEHEFSARLSRAYKPACMYLNCFMSTFASIIAHNVAFFSGSICAVILVLTVIDEDVLQVEHVITILTVTGVLTALSRVFIPEENFIFCPELLLKSVLAHIHYMPATWRTKAHTSTVRNEFSKFFQLKVTFFVEELVSPLITPLILIFSFRNKSLEVVDFLRNFSIDVAGVGDVCSFAQLDVHKHGNPHWMDEDDVMTNGKASGDAEEKERALPSQAMQSEDGKTELSLVNFALTNPDWKPGQASEIFLANLKGQVRKDASMMISVRNVEHTGILHSMQTSSMFLQPLSIPPVIKESIFEHQNMGSIIHHHNHPISQQGAQTDVPLKGKGIALKTGPLYQVNATSDETASMYLTQTSSYGNQVVSQHSALSLAASLSNTASGFGETMANMLSNDVITQEMSATVLKLHDRFHHNHASRSVHLGSSSSSYNGQPYQLNDDGDADGSGSATSTPAHDLKAGGAPVTARLVVGTFEDTFDDPLPPLEKPPTDTCIL